jgi:hypothetical protein
MPYEVLDEVLNETSSEVFGEILDAGEMECKALGASLAGDWTKPAWRAWAARIACLSR